MFFLVIFVWKASQMLEGDRSTCLVLNCIVQGFIRALSSLLYSSTQHPYINGNTGRHCTARLSWQHISMRTSWKCILLFHILSLMAVISTLLVWYGKADIYIKIANEKTDTTSFLISKFILGTMYGSRALFRDICDLDTMMVSWCGHLASKLPGISSRIEGVNGAEGRIVTVQASC